MLSAINACASFLDSNYIDFLLLTILLNRRVVVVSSNISTECWVLNVPEITAGGDNTAEAEGFAVEEPDDEKNFTMVDKGE